MSNLINSLRKISSWFRENKYEITLQPGLSLEAITERAQELTFKLPEEIYDLYQFCNGTKGYKSFFPGFRFLSLELAMEEYHYNLSIEEERVEAYKRNTDPEKLPFIEA